MICPNCNKGEVKQNISLFCSWRYKKVVEIYCPLCNFRNKHTFSISKQDFEAEQEQRRNQKNMFYQSNRGV